MTCVAKRLIYLGWYFLTEKLQFGRKIWGLLWRGRYFMV